MTRFFPANLVAHRGHQAHFPENSLLAIQDAIRLGATKIEFDVQLSKDGKLVLCHDASILRMTGTNVPVWSLCAEALHTYFAAESTRFGSRFSHNKITFFSELLPLVFQYPEIDFFMELKEDSIHYFGLSETLNHIVRQLPLIPNNLYFISYHEEAVLLAKTIGFSRSGLVFKDWERRNELLKKTRASVGFINFSRIDDNEMIVADVPIIVYESCDKNQVQSLLERGAAAVETFCLAHLLE